MTCWQTTWRATLTLALLLFGAAASARADFIYDVTVDTSSLVDSSGNPLAASPGFLDLQFNPSGGTGTLSATVQALATNDTTLGAVINVLGNVTGPGGSAPGAGLPLTFAADNTNGPQINDAVLNVTFGMNLALSLDITPADANSTASFFLTLFDQAGNPVSSISYDPSNPSASGTNLSAVELDLVANPSGSSPSVSPPLLGVGADVQPAATATPAPPSVVLLGTALACLVGYGLVQRKRLPVAA